MKQESFTRDGWDKKAYKQLCTYLRNCADDGYRQFSSALIPDCKDLLGVRIPVLRALGKEIAQGNWRSFLAVSKKESFEETVLKGIVIGLAPLSVCEWENYVSDYLPWIDNWALCDYFCSGLKQIKRYKKECLPLLQICLISENPWTRRVGLVLLRSYYLEEEYLSDLFLWAEKTICPHYYVQMAHAWLLADCYTKFPKQTEAYLKTCDLNCEILNMTAQKIRDSYRVPKEWKEKAEIFRRKK